MKKLILVLTLGLLAVSSCKKEEKEPVTLEFLQGTWSGDTVLTHVGKNLDLWAAIQIKGDSIQLFSRYITDAYDTCYLFIPDQPLYEQYYLQGTLNLDGFDFTIEGNLVLNTDRSPTSCDWFEFTHTYGEIYEKDNNVFLTTYRGGYGLKDYPLRKQ